MKIFKVRVRETEWDCIESVAVLATTRENAIALAIEYNPFFNRNIGEVEEIEMNSEKVIHDHVIYG